MAKPDRKPRTPCLAIIKANRLERGASSIYRSPSVHRVSKSVHQVRPKNHVKEHQKQEVFLCSSTLNSSYKFHGFLFWSVSGRVQPIQVIEGILFLFLKVLGVVLPSKSEQSTGANFFLVSSKYKIQVLFNSGKYSHVLKKYYLQGNTTSRFFCSSDLKNNDETENTSLCRLRVGKKVWQNANFRRHKKVENNSHAYSRISLPRWSWWKSRGRESNVERDKVKGLW